MSYALLQPRTNKIINAHTHLPTHTLRHIHTPVLDICLCVISGLRLESGLLAGQRLWLLRGPAGSAGLLPGPLPPGGSRPLSASLSRLRHCPSLIEDLALLHFFPPLLRFLPPLHPILLLFLFLVAYKKVFAGASGPPIFPTRLALLQDASHLSLSDMMGAVVF